MKTIFIATDFSEAARNASLYGIELAKAVHADVVLFHAYQTPVTLPHAMVSVAEEADRINPSGILSIETICEESISCEAIIEKANDKNADMIIVGMKEGGKGLRRLFGSTATALIRKTNLPFLVIPETATYSTPKIITLASDIDEEMETNIHLLYPLRELAEKFESRIYVVKVNKAKINKMYELSARPHNLNCLLAKLDVKYEYADDYNVTHALAEFVKEHKADLLVMIPHKHDFLERIFTKSDTKDMLFHTLVPLLILPEKPDETRQKQASGPVRQKLKNPANHNSFSIGRVIAPAEQ